MYVDSIENRIDLKNNMLCPGCGHLLATKLIAEVLIENKISDKTIFCIDVACCSLLIEFVHFDMLMASHGRVMPTTYGIKQMLNQNVVVSYMGDGAAYSIGLNELMHSAIRNDKAFVIVINNQYLSMTGGQVSPTSLINQITSSTQDGKKKEQYGNPFKIEDVLHSFDIAYLARGSLADKKRIDYTKYLIEQSFHKYINNEGFCLVEILSPCPTNNHMNIVDTNKKIIDEVEKIYNLGEFIK